MTCSEEGCSRPATARGLCLKHYKRARRLGLEVLRPRGAGLAFLRAVPATDECVPYPFGRFPSGYGHVKYEGRDRPAHVVAYLLHVGPIDEGLEVCHECGHRPCVNPRHLRQDTHVGNMADCVEHGTHPRGERNGRARLSVVDVAAIRTGVAAGHRQVDLAAALGVSPQAVNNVVRGRRWVHA